MIFCHFGRLPILGYYRSHPNTKTILLYDVEFFKVCNIYQDQFVFRCALYEVKMQNMTNILYFDTFLQVIFRTNVGHQEK